MSEHEFESIVALAIKNIPKPFDAKIAEVNFKVEELPSIEQKHKLGLRDCDALFGLYEGIPLTKRNGTLISKAPDVITIFMHPMVDLYSDKLSLQKKIYETVWHEVAHFYGLDHNHIHKIKNRIN